MTYDATNSFLLTAAFSIDRVCNTIGLPSISFRQANPKGKGQAETAASVREPAPALAQMRKAGGGAGSYLQIR
jgi:hypothetical protein